jgi:pimeloyl-ACP methyl ester carboxylesterase
MENYRIHGRGGIDTAVIHGGPGAAGSMAFVAKKLSSQKAIIEPFQTKDTIAEQVKELKDVLRSHCDIPVYLVGHSWGAWLCCLFAAENPLLVKKAILIASAPFGEKYAEETSKKRLARLGDKQKSELVSLQKLLLQQDLRNKSIYMAGLSSILLKADSYDLVLGPREKINMRYAIFQNVWAQAEEMRRSGEILEKIKMIQCPVTVIHGDYDPHPFMGVKEPLQKILKKLDFVLLSKCGHYPWLEKNAKDRFFEILYQEIKP